MELTAKELMALCAMVDRLKKEKAVLTCRVEWLLDMLVQKEIMSSHEKKALDNAVEVQRDVAKKTELAENELMDPTAEPLPVELTQELTSLGVLPDSPTIADTLDTDFEDVLQKVLVAFRRSTGHDGEAGTVWLKCSRALRATDGDHCPASRPVQRGGPAKQSAFMGKGSVWYGTNHVLWRNCSPCIERLPDRVCGPGSVCRSSLGAC